MTRPATLRNPNRFINTPPVLNAYDSYRIGKGPILSIETPEILAQLYRNIARSWFKSINLGDQACFLNSAGKI